MPNIGILSGFVHYCAIHWLAKAAASREFEENILTDEVKASILDLLIIAKTQFLRR